MIFFTTSAVLFCNFGTRNFQALLSVANVTLGISVFLATFASNDGLTQTKENASSNKSSPKSLPSSRRSSKSKCRSSDFERGHLLCENSSGSSSRPSCRSWQTRDRDFVDGRHTPTSTPFSSASNSASSWDPRRPHQHRSKHRMGSSTPTPNEADFEPKQICTADIHREKTPTGRTTPTGPMRRTDIVQLAQDEIAVEQLITEGTLMRRVKRSTSNPKATCPPEIRSHRSSSASSGTSKSSSIKTDVEAASSLNKSFGSHDEDHIEEAAYVKMEVLNKHLPETPEEEEMPFIKKLPLHPKASSTGDDSFMSSEEEVVKTQRRRSRSRSSSSSGNGRRTNNVPDRKSTKVKKVIPNVRSLPLIANSAN